MTATLIAQAAQGGNFDIQTIVTFVLMFVIVYFVLIRPGNMEKKALKKLQDGLKPGDKVVTTGGIYGIVREVQDKTLKLEIAANTVIKIATASVAAAVEKDGSVSETK